MRKNLLAIAKYYNLAWSCINTDNLKGAIKAIHNEMPAKLYDLSLNIEDNTTKLKANEEDEQLIILFEETKHLITKVNNRLDEISSENLEYVLEDTELSKEEMSLLQDDKFDKQF